MAAYVHADSENSKRDRIKIFSNSRIITAKIHTLFSGELVVYICMIIAAASLMLTDSYYKAYKTNLKTNIIKMINDTKELEWQKDLSQRNYLKMTSSDELMKKARDMKISVMTSDKVVKLD